MKLAYIANSRFPSEKAQSDHVMAMCASFAALGHEVTLLVPDRRPVMAEDPFAYYQKPKTFAFHRVPCIDALRWSWLGPLGLWIQTATFVFSLRRAFHRIQPDVIYSRELYVFFGRASRARRIWESHSLHHAFWATWMMKRLDGIVTLTRESKKRLEEIGVRKDRIFVEPDAVDPTLFQSPPSREEARVSLGVLPEEFLCLYTGKFTTMGMSKGLDEAIAAVRILRADGKNVRMLAVGGTPDEIKRYTPSAGEGVTLLGHQPQRDLIRYYAAADALLMPFPYTEHYAYFMSPLKLFEYLMSGVPMVVTDLPSVREVVNEAEAFIAKPGDISSLVEQIAFIMNDSEEAQKRAHAARYLSERYTWRERANRIATWGEGL